MLRTTVQMAAWGWCALLAFAPAARAADVEVNYWHAQYDIAFNNTSSMRRYVDRDEISHWSASYVLRSLWEMHAHSGDAKYLEELIYQVEVLMKRSEDFGWPTERYSRDRKPAVWLAHTGSLLYPALLAAEKMRKPEMANRIFEGRTFAAIADEWVFFAQESLDQFDSHQVKWTETFGRPKGTQTLYYKFPIKFPTDPRLQNTMYPFNMQNIAGKCFMVLYELTGEKKYRTQAVGLANFMINRFGKFKTKSKETGYLWTYRPTEKRAYPSGSGGPDDIGHAYHSVDFVLEAAERKGVFSKTHARRVAVTVGRILDTVAETNRTRPAETIDNMGTGNWSDMFRIVAACQYRLGIYEALERQALLELNAGPGDALEIALLARYANP